MKGLEDVYTFAVAGDWHGDFRYACKAMAYAARHGCEVLIQLGDFGYYHEDRYVTGLDIEAKRLGIHLLFIDGNHEHHRLLLHQPVDDDGVRRLKDRVWHLPRGYRWDWHGIKFLALGGAYSIDRTWLVPYVEWFPEETLTIEQMYRATQGGDVHVMFTHEPPNRVLIPNLNEGIAPRNELELAHEHQTLVGKVVDEVHAKILWHGHMHRKYHDFRLNPITGEKTLVKGLDMNKRPLEDNVDIVNLYDLFQTEYGDYEAFL